MDVFDSVTPIVIAIIALVCFAGAIPAAIVLPTSGKSAAALILFIGCLCVFYSVIALACGAPFVVSIGIFIGCISMGLAIGLNDRIRN